MRYLVASLLLVFIYGCSVQPTIKKSKIVVFKTKQIKFSDVAYLTKSDDSVEIDLYVAGNAFKKISIDGMVCVDREGCMRKSSFNEEYLSSAYPDDLLKNVFLGKPIYEGRNLHKTANGFEQNISDNGVDIAYKVEENQIYFKDTINKILIKIKDI
ncbi:hypothetical protein [Sulfurimonas sp.]|uniref:hypothetical protein n=1 Tax=Sulfurimonas sp. TaxID=2022749 RepID=UPI003D0E5B17